MRMSILKMNTIKKSTKVLIGFCAVTLLAICAALISVATIAAPILASGAV